MDLNEAVRKLRERTGDSQQSFATRLGLSIRAVVNYEKDRKPSPRALAAMAHLARKHREYELANQFWSALPEELAMVPVVKVSPDTDVSAMKVIFEMLPKIPGPIPEEGAEIPLSDPRRSLTRYARDLESVISGDAPAVVGAPAVKIKEVAEGLRTVAKYLGQKVRVFPGKVEFKDLGPKGAK